MTHTILLYVKCVCLVTRSCLTVCDTMGCSPRGSSVYGILQTRILEWVAVASSKGSSEHRDSTQVSPIACGFFTVLSHQGSPHLNTYNHTTKANIAVYFYVILRCHCGIIFPGDPCSQEARQFHILQGYSSFFIYLFIIIFYL